MIKEQKAGWKTSEFWLTILGIGAVQGLGIDPETNAQLQGGLIAIYTIGRSLYKAFF